MLAVGKGRCWTYHPNTASTRAGGGSVVVTNARFVGRRSVRQPLHLTIDSSTVVLPSMKWWRAIQNVADVDDVHLPSQTFVGGIYGYDPAIPAEPRMQVNSV
jgi:hypothetical protein